MKPILAICGVLLIAFFVVWMMGSSSKKDETQPIPNVERKNGIAVKAIVVINPGNPTGDKHRDESPLEHPDVKRAIELFAGKIVHVRRGSASNDQRDDEDT